jgi:TonB family protein
MKSLIFKLFTIAVIIIPMAISSANAQNDQVSSMQELEKKEDENMDYIKKINKIIKDYPTFSYSYVIEDGEIVNVEVTGVDNVIDRKRLEVAILDLQSNRNMIKNTANRIGVFYSYDEKPKFNGENDIESALRNNLIYPQDAQDWGVEGTIYVKFVVDENGQIPFATTSSDIETSVEAYVSDLEQQAINAVKETSGDWQPGKVNGVEVPTMVILPVTFDLRSDPYIRGWIY